MTLKELFLKVGITLDEKDLKTLDDSVDKVNGALLAVGAGALAATAALGLMVVATAHESAEIAKLAGLMGISTEAAQELAYVSQQTGVDVKDMGELMAELSENAVEAAEGTGESAAAFKGLGINVKDANGKMKSAEVLLGEIADGMAKGGLAIEETAQLMGLFGEQGINLGPILALGSEGIENLRREARDLGLVMEDHVIKDGVELTKQLNVLEAILRSLRNAIGAEVIPVLLELGDGFIAWYKVNQNIIKQRIGRVFEVIAGSARMAWRFLSIFLDVLGWVAEKIGLLTGGLDGALMIAVVLLTGAFALLGLAALHAGLSAAAAWVAASWPLIAMAALVGVLLLLIEDFIFWMNGGQSALGDLLGTWDEFWASMMTDNPNDPWWLVAIKESLQLAKELIDTLKQLDPSRITEAPKQIAEGLVHAFTTPQSQKDREMYEEAWNTGDPEYRAKKTQEAQKFIESAQMFAGFTPATWRPYVAGGAASLAAPAPAQNITQEFKAEFTLNGVTGSPEEIATKVEEKIGEWWAKTLRAAKGAF